MNTNKLLIAALVLVALSGVLWYSNNHPDWGKEKKDQTEAPVLLNVTDASVEGIEVQQRDMPKVVLQRKAGKWEITAPAAFAADQEAVASLLTSLAPANGERVIDDKPGDVAKYGLASPSVLVVVHEKGGRSEQIALGNNLTVNSTVYVQVGGNPRVLAAASALKTALDKTLNDLRDKRVLTFDQSHLTRVTLASAKNSNIEFGKNGQGEWGIVKPQPYRADNLLVDELLRKLSETRMDLTLPPADTEKFLSKFNAGKPLATVTLTDSASTQTFEVRQSGEDYFAKSSVVPGAHKLNADLAKELQKPLDDFRDKKVFAFGFNDPVKVEINGKSFLKSGSDWKIDGKNMDPEAIEGLVFQLRDLAAGGFATEGFTAPAATITVVSSFGKLNEKVEFSKTADGYLARRAGEPTLYKLDAKTVNDILEASTKVKPAPGKK